MIKKCLRPYLFSKNDYLNVSILYSTINQCRKHPDDVIYSYIDMAAKNG